MKGMWTSSGTQNECGVQSVSRVEKCIEHKGIAKKHIYEGVIVSIALYGAEGWGKC